MKSSTLHLTPVIVASELVFSATTDPKDRQDIVFLCTPPSFPALFTIIAMYSGESYAGIYVPTLADTVMKMNEKAVNAENLINLKGFMASVCP